MALPDTLIRCYSPTCGGAPSPVELTDTVRGEPVHSMVLALCCTRCGRVLATRLRPAGWPNESGPVTPAEISHARTPWTPAEIGTIEAAIATYGDTEYRCGHGSYLSLAEHTILRARARAALQDLRRHLGLPEPLTTQEH